MKPLAYEPYEKLLSRTLAHEHVHVWCISLAIPEDCLNSFEQVLSPDERARADRFRFAVHRQHFVSARGVLRHLLSHYANISPAHIRFQEGTYGKPELAEPPQMRFNASHSAELGLYALAHKREVGVDIEQHRAMDDLESIAKHYFARDEVARLATLSPENRNAAFFRCWSRKEAFVKALGAGLSLPLDSFCVSIDEEPDAAIQGQPLGSSAGEWRLFDVTPRAGYSAALVTEGQPGAIYCALVENPAKLVDEMGRNGGC